MVFPLFNYLNNKKLSGLILEKFDVVHETLRRFSTLFRIE